jgi:hypothetical protein
VAKDSRPEEGRGLAGLSTAAVLPPFPVKAAAAHGGKKQKVGRYQHADREYGIKRSYAGSSFRAFGDGRYTLAAPQRAGIPLDPQTVALMGFDNQNR